MLDTGKLKKFASKARADLMDQVSAKLDHVLNTDSAELREKAHALEDLKKQIRETSKEAVIERVAYTWFNRFCALRFMDVNRYNRIGIVSPADGATQPELLAEAKQGHIDERFLEGHKAQHIFKLLGGAISSKNPQAEAYRLLIVAACNHYHRAMPYLFERIEDYTELLMPDDLLSDNSILADVRDAIGTDDCKDVEIIGWLYQYYISAKKDAVFEALKKKKKKIGADDIPAATQLFTPHWIVRYLVENSLGRLWLLNNPNSNLKSKMEYYIEPEEAETDFLKISSPEEIKVCDPACGSGHMLTYAFDLLYAIYEDQGYDATEIPELILTKNLHGIEIDERAGSLAAFALSMKARDKNRRFLEKNIQPNICVLENISFTKEEFSPYREVLGQDLLSQPLLQTLGQFSESDNFGSLIQPAMENSLSALKELEREDFTNDLFLQPIHQNVIKALTQADYLSQKYHVVIANPPYMGNRNMNNQLSSWLKNKYPNTKVDLFSSFVYRCSSLSVKNGYVGIMSPNVWMYISSHELLRSFLVEGCTITNLVELPLTGFKGATVQICAYNFINCPKNEIIGDYIRLVNFKGSELDMADYTLEAIANRQSKYRYSFPSHEFKRLPGMPIAYWVSESIIEIFSKHNPIYDVSISDGQNITANNDRYLRAFWEVDNNKIEPNGRWSFYAKGGDYRKWFGNIEYVVNWSKKAQEEYKKHPSARIIPEYIRFREGITWTLVTSAKQSYRYLPSYATFDKGGSSIFFHSSDDLRKCLMFLNSKVSECLTRIFNATLNLQVDDVRKLPLSPKKIKFNEALYEKLIAISRYDWHSYETSNDFKELPLLKHCDVSITLSEAYKKIRSQSQVMINDMKRLEEENNLEFIEAYGLQNELDSDTPIEEVTLTCNPNYRYGKKRSPEELDKKILSDTMQEFIHYAVGCMFGRYSIDKPGLILANQGDTIAEYKAQIPDSRFDADEDNVIPILDDNWFEDDIVERFQKFLRVTFGEEHYKANLEFIETAIGKSLRKYFTKDFYDYHVKRFKKRPIYWMFSSPKGTFNALIYMHRYRPDTASVVLNDYLRDFRSKLEAKKTDCEQTQISTSSSDAEKNRATKEIDKIKTMLDELNHWEKDVLHPLATQRIDIDLDDGVKVNYPKFGSALKPIKGLEVNDK